MAAALKRGVQEQIHQLAGKAGADNAAAHAQSIGVVVAGGGTPAGGGRSNLARRYQHEDRQQSCRQGSASFSRKSDVKQVRIILPGGIL